MRRIVLLVVLAACLVALKVSAAEQAERGEESGAVVNAVANAGASSAGVLSGAAGRTRYTLGRFGGRIIGPAVTGMTEKHAADIAALQPAISRASPQRRDRARQIDRRRAEADSLALVMLDEGRPVAAVRYAMRASGLVDAVRHQVTEELIR